ncbi:MAG: FHA domain-containing protein, partial [Myxococcota bacterium]
MDKKISFKIYYGDEFIGEETYSDALIKIGRLSSVNLKLDDPTVSRVHAHIEATSDGYLIKDMGSSAGTIVNGETVERAVLNDGDEILLGKTKLIVSIDKGVIKSPVAVAPVVEEEREEVVKEEKLVSPKLEKREVQKSKPKENIKPQGASKRDLDEHEEEEKDPYGNRAIEVKFLWYMEMVDVKYFTYPQKVTIGSTSKCDFYIIPDEITIPEYPVIRTVNREYQLTFPRNVEGEVYIGESSKSFKDLIDEKRALPDPQIPDSYIYTLPPNSIT